MQALPLALLARGDDHSRSDRKSDLSPFSRPVNPVFRNLMFFVGVVIAVGSLLYWRHTQSDAYLQRILSHDVDVDATKAKMQKWNMAPELVSKMPSLSDFDRRRYGLALSLQIPLLLNLTLNESVAVLGFVVVVATRNFLVLIPFAAAAIGLNAAMFPRLDGLMERSERLRSI